jgi:predicted ATP-dependent protease
MAICYLCETNERKYFSYYCETCVRIKRMISLWGVQRVYEIIEHVLVRTHDEQNKKITEELDTETKILDNETKILRSKNKY